MWETGCISSEVPRTALTETRARKGTVCLLSPWVALWKFIEVVKLGAPRFKQNMSSDHFQASVKGIFPPWLFYPPLNYRDWTCFNRDVPPSWTCGQHSYRQKPSSTFIYMPGWMAWMPKRKYIKTPRNSHWFKHMVGRTASGGNTMLGRAQCDGKSI